MCHYVSRGMYRKWGEDLNWERTGTIFICSAKRAGDHCQTIDIRKEKYSL